MTPNPAHPPTALDRDQPQLVLASSSPARRKLLQDAGLVFEVQPSTVDEQAVLAAAQSQQQAPRHGADRSPLTPAQTAQLLAVAKARQVAQDWADCPALILGCDSVFEFAGQAYGKPYQLHTARERIRMISGKSGLLHTGHHLIFSQGSHRWQEVSELRTARVYFDTLTPEEIEAYLASGEPLWVAGSFTIDGFGSAFIRQIEGEYHTVVGLSVNALRAMMSSFGQPISNFWTKTP